MATEHTPVLDSYPDEMPTDAEIARATEPRPVADVAADLGLASDEIEQYGDHKAKLTRAALERLRQRPADGKLVLVTAMTPTPKGEGKTVTTVGLTQALHGLGESVVAAIREPSLGPVFGLKGGAAGGGYSQVLPMEDVNLHFTGDIHAVTAAHDLLAAMLDNHLHRGNDLDVDVDRVEWPRALDVDDRALRETVVGLGGPGNGPPREAGFQITAASEVMAVLGLATDLADLRERLARIVVAYDRDGEPVTAGDLEAAGAMAALLRDALRPNLVGTIEGAPAFVHGGPFANIAHGTNTLVADRAGLALADYVVTEAGFGADLGAEKFVDLLAPRGLAPDVAVLVATVRALKRQGRAESGADGDRSAGSGDRPTDSDSEAVRDESDPEAVRAGLPNLRHHADVLRSYGLPVVVAVNRFPTDTEAELAAVLEGVAESGLPAAVSEVHARGGEGGHALARLVRDAVADETSVTPLYDPDDSVAEKLWTVATEVYGADAVAFTDAARTDLDRLRRHGFDNLPVCVSKTPLSLSDDRARRGVPEDWTLTVRELSVSAGAGFVVALTGDVLTMPGLPEDPAAAGMDVTEEGEITGLF